VFEVIESCGITWFRLGLDSSRSSRMSWLKLQHYGAIDIWLLLLSAPLKFAAELKKFSPKFGSQFQQCSFLATWYYYFLMP